MASPDNSADTTAADLDSVARAAMLLASCKGLTSARVEMRSRVGECEIEHSISVDFAPAQDAAA